MRPNSQSEFPLCTSQASSPPQAHAFLFKPAEHGTSDEAFPKDETQLAQEIRKAEAEGKKHD